MNGHKATPQPTTVYSWRSMPGDESRPDDYPMSAMCDVCGVPIDRASIADDWEHRAEGAMSADVPAWLP